MVIWAELLRELRTMRFLEVCERVPGTAAELYGGGGELRRERAHVSADAGPVRGGGRGRADGRRVGKPSLQRIGADEAARVVALYRERYRDWTATALFER